MSRSPRRGDVYWVTLDPVVGTEMRMTRPAVIVSNDSCNRYGTRVVVLPITSNVTSLYPGEAMVAVKGKPGRASDLARHRSVGLDTSPFIYHLDGHATYASVTSVLFAWLEQRGAAA